MPHPGSYSLRGPVLPSVPPELSRAVLPRSLFRAGFGGLARNPAFTPLAVPQKRLVTGPRGFLGSISSPGRIPRCGGRYHQRRAWTQRLPGAENGPTGCHDVIYQHEGAFRGGPDPEHRRTPVIPWHFGLAGTEQRWHQKVAPAAASHAG